MMNPFKAWSNRSSALGHCLIFLIGWPSFNGFGAQFTNLDFEAARPGNETPGLFGRTGPVSELLPGWNLYFGSNLVDTVGYNSWVLSGAFPMATIFDSNAFFASAFEIEGTFAFRAITLRNGPRFILQQTGEIPEWARLMSMKVSRAPVSLRINDVLVPSLENLNAADGYASFDISMFSDLEVDLELIAANGLETTFGTELAFVDDIVFLVPEPPPSSFLMIFLAGLLGTKWMAGKRGRRPLTS
jgi:hypothetical protein